MGRFLIQAFVILRAFMDDVAVESSVLLA